MNRRGFPQRAGALAAGAPGLAAAPLAAAESEMKAATAAHLPRWRGFNLPEMACKDLRGDKLDRRMLELLLQG